MGLLLPFLLIGGLLLVATQSGKPSVPSTPLPPGIPSNGKDDVGDLPEPQRSAVWLALNSPVSSPESLDLLATTLDSTGFRTAAGRCRARAAQIRASGGIVAPPPGVIPGGGVAVTPKPIPGVTPGLPFVPLNPGALVPTPQPGPIPEPLRTLVFNFMNTHRKIAPDEVGSELPPTPTDLAEIVRVAYTYPDEWDALRRYVIRWDPDNYLHLPNPSATGGFIPNIGLPDPLTYFSTHT